MHVAPKRIHVFKTELNPETGNYSTKRFKYELQNQVLTHRKEAPGKKKEALRLPFMMYSLAF